MIGASTGGMKALQVIAGKLPGDFPLSLCVVQHQYPHGQIFLAKFLENSGPLPAKVADEKEALRPGRFYVAPPNYHLLIEEDRTFSLSVDEAVNHSRPSIDVLFETAAEVYGRQLIGVILTGANSDGTLGLKRIAEEGGTTLVQDPATADAPEMPRAAIEAVAVDFVLPLEEVGACLVDLCGR